MHLGSDYHSREIGACATVTLHLLLLAGLVGFGSRASLTAVEPVPGRAVLQLQVNHASSAPPSQAVTQPKTEPRPEPKPVPKPKPAPKPEPVVQARPEPRPQPQPQAEEADAVPTKARTDSEADAAADETAVEASAQAGNPDAPERNADLTQRLVALLHQRIEAVKHYPFAARKAGITGTVGVVVEIDSAARITGYRVADPDQANGRLRTGAEQTMDRLVGVRLAEVRLSSPLLVEVPIVYELR
ncbi:MAG: hypothetical protein AB7E32_10580 [Desulfovibrio sp.]